jgi:unsaturated rhamnogalacturonyl hydrolase
MIRNVHGARARTFFAALLLPVVFFRPGVGPCIAAPGGGEDSLRGSKAVGLDVFYNNEWKELPNGERVRYHYVWDDTANSGFSILGGIITAGGGTIETRTSAPTASGLSSLRVYIIVDPDTPKESPDPHLISSGAADTIEAWVRAGGKLVLLGNDVGNAEFTAWNGLAERFGIHFNEDSHHRVVGTAFSVGTCDSFPSHPLWEGIRRVYLKEVSSLRLTPPAVPLLAHDGFVLAATSTVGAGCVVAVGDPWLYNEYMYARKLPPGYDNARAARNLFHWLLEGGR